MVENGKEPLLSVRGLVQEFRVRDRVLRAVGGVSFDLMRGEALGIVGESGSGKSTTAKAIIGINKISGGEILFRGVDIAKREKSRKNRADDARAGAVRSGIQMVFQDPLSSLNPRMTVLDTVCEGLIIKGMRDVEYIRRRGCEMLERVGLSRAVADRYPHELSGGQRQRIGIARAVIMEPELIIADEPVSALDVSVQAQIINLLSDLGRELRLSVLFIAHDLSVVRHLCDRIGVMYLGRLVELAKSDELFENPVHPYTRALLSAIPIPNPLIERGRKRIVYNKEDFCVINDEMHEISDGHFVLPFE